MINTMTTLFAMRDATHPEIDASEEAGSMTAMSEDDFRAFYERTARPLWAYLSRITGDSQLADDLLQDAYYRFYRAGAAHENESHRRNSLFQIATNLARDAGRKSRRRNDVPLDDEIGAPVAAGCGTDDRVLQRTDLARAMERLGEVQREMLWLAYVQGSSHVEIASVLGLRPGSIKTLLYRARKKLADILLESDQTSEALS